MNEIPVSGRTQRRLERRQMVTMVVLVLAVTVASFFLGVMVGERGSFSGSKVEPPRLPMAQVPPPPLPSGVSAAPQKLTFYDDLPKGNSAPLGSGINLPKGGYLPPPAVASPAPAPAAPAPVAAPAAPAPAPAVAKTPPAPAPATAKAPAPAPVAAAAPKASAGGAFVVQVAATKDQAEARRMIDKLKAKGFSATMEKADLGAKGVWYRVTAGSYGDQAAADKAAGQLKKQGFSAIVRKK